jgi:transcriptional regulator PpsR
VKASVLSGENQPVPGLSAFRWPKETIGDLDAETAARIMAASSDIAMVIDRGGIIRDVAVTGADMPTDGLADMVDRHWVDTVTSESRRKVEELLNDAQGSRASRSREINQQYPNGSIPIRYMALNAGRDGRIIALGRDLRPVEQLQQRVLKAQQAMERDYARLRQAESRYRVLFQIASEAVLIVDPTSKKIVEANPAAGALLAVDYATLAGKPLAKLLHPETRDAAMARLVDPNIAERTEAIPLRLADGRTGYTATASLFRQDGGTHVLISLAPARSETTVPGDDARLKLLRVLNRIPDAFVLTDEAFNIRDVNLAFLELSQIANAEVAKGQSLGRFIGRPGVDLKVLTESLNEHGWVRNFATVIRTIYGDQEDVELSAVSVREGLEVSHGFVIRPARRVASAAPAQIHQLPRTAEQLTQLVGRVSLREIVAETTSVIERMCIEAALNLTGNNRASAAEVLGLSRQSLYSKLNRHSVGRSDPEQSAED